MVFQEEHAKQFALRTLDLRKVYRDGKVAVTNISFGMAPHTCMGVLGQNGAGEQYS